MELTPFWPPAQKHIVHTLSLRAPDTLSPAARHEILNCLCITDALRNLQNTGMATPSIASDLLKERLSIALEKLSVEFDDPDTRDALRLRAHAIRDASLRADYLPLLAGKDETELVCVAGLMSTWIGKSKDAFYFRGLRHTQRGPAAKIRCAGHS